MKRDEAVAILVSPEGRDETRRVYLLGRTFDFVLHMIDSGDHSREEAERMIDALAELAERYFPGSAEQFAIIYGHRLSVAIDEVYGKSD
ncbi:MAG TPA: hypothetical protein VGL13_09110 [Polyangiaceae bacterium]|jgi:hypothetical protein